GTEVAGIAGAIDDADGIVGTAPGVRIHAVKVLNDNGKADFANITEALAFVTARKLENPSVPVVANLSLGADVKSTAYSSIDRAVAMAVEAGVVVERAAGNAGRDASTASTANVAEAITVGAYDRHGRLASFSNSCAALDLLAPGEAVETLTNTGGLTTT